MNLQVITSTKEAALLEGASGSSGDSRAGRRLGFWKQNLKIFIIAIWDGNDLKTFSGKLVAQSFLKSQDLTLAIRTSAAR